MLSFGQRLKLLRNEADISQSDLADALGVSAQSVSKWECDAYCPDLSLLLPLSAVLGVTADCLLGAGTNEKEDIEQLNKEIKELNCEPWKPGKENFCYIVYSKAKDLLKKYPLNYDLKYDCAYYLYSYLNQGSHYKLFEIPTDEYEKLWDEGVRMLLSLKKRDNDPSRLAYVCDNLVEYYTLKGKWSEAESVAFELPKLPFTQDRELYTIACVKDDREEAEAIARRMARSNLLSYSDSLCGLAGRISIFGNARKEEAIAIYKKQYEVAYDFENLFADDYEYLRDAQYYQIKALSSMSCCYLAIDKLNDALDCVEKITDIVIKFYPKAKEMQDPEDRESYLSELKFYPLVWCYNAVIADDDNILTREERFKACKARLDALE